MNVTIAKSKAKGKKYAAVFQQDDNKLKTINFGARGYDDYTIHHDKNRQKNYLARHINDSHAAQSAGELSRVILWSSPSLRQGAANYGRIHKMSVKLRL